jgi:hypothetical protein
MFEDGNLLYMQERPIQETEKNRNLYLTNEMVYSFIDLRKTRRKLSCLPQSLPLIKAILVLITTYLPPGKILVNYESRAASFIVLVDLFQAGVMRLVLSSCRHLSIKSRYQVSRILQS